MMAFKIKCESCGGRIHKIWDTLSFYQTITDGGFSATLFGEKRKQRNTESKLLKELQYF